MTGRFGFKNLARSVYFEILNFAVSASASST